MSEAVVRPYRPRDHAQARALWVELEKGRRELYGLPPEPDPGAGFEDYLTRLDLSGVWVADDPGEGVIGLVGLLMHGTGAEVEPIVVAARHRGSGVGATLLKHVTEEAGRRSLARLTIRPESRNVDALRSLHAAGFDLLSAVELSLDPRSGRRSGARGGRSETAPDKAENGAGIELFGLRFRT